MNKEQLRNSPAARQIVNALFNLTQIQDAAESLGIDPESITPEKILQQEPTTGSIWTTVEEPDGAIRIIRAEGNNEQV